MLTCMANSTMEKINDKQPSKTLSSQIKHMVLKASGAYRHCTPCANQQKRDQRNLSDGEPDKSRRTWSSSSGRKELEARLRVISSGDGTPASASGRRVEPVVFVEESEPKEWVAQVEPGVLITFFSSPKGGNDLKRVRFSQEVFNKWQAHRWWNENCEKVMELYNVQSLNRQAFPLPATPRPEDDMSSKARPISENPLESPLLGEQQPHTSGSTKTSSFRDAAASGEISLNRESYLDTEWVEQDEPGVYLTIRALPDGRKELMRVRFSRDKFRETHARLWWEENRARINKQYL